MFEAADDTPACALHAMLSFRTREEQAKILEVMCRNSKADGMKGIIVDPEDLEPKK